jgi:hypothetical protein
MTMGRDVATTGLARVVQRAGPEVPMLWIAFAAAFEHVYTAGDIVNLREDASTDARVLARLPSGTSLAADDITEEWVHVSVTARPPEHPLVGWIRADLVAEALPPAPTPAASPWLAQCDGRRAWLVGRVSGGRFLDVSLGADGDFPSDAVLDERLREVAVQHWYTAEGQLEPGSFVTPFRVSEAAIFEGGGDGWVPGDTEAAERRTAIALGGCSLRGQVYASAPIAAVATRPAGAADLRRILPTVPDDVSGIVAVHGPAGGTEIVTFAETDVPNCGDEAVRDMGAFWSWIAADGTRSEPFLVGMGHEARLAGWMTIAGVTLGVVYSEDMTATSSVIEVDRAGGATVTHVVLRQFGC